MVGKIARKAIFVQKKHAARIVDAIMPQSQHTAHIVDAIASQSQHAARIADAIAPQSHPRDTASGNHSHSRRFMARLCQIPEDYKVERVRVQ